MGVPVQGIYCPGVCPRTLPVQTDGRREGVECNVMYNAVCYGGGRIEVEVTNSQSLLIITGYAKCLRGVPIIVKPIRGIRAIVCMHRISRSFGVAGLRVT